MQTWIPFPDSADAALRKVARAIGEAISGRSGTTIAKATGGALSRMPAWMASGHMRAAIAGNGRDIARVASVRDPSGYFGKSAEILEETARVERLPPGPFRAVLERAVEKRADELAAHQDRPTREHALSAAAHRALACEHEERAYHERHAGNHAGEHAHEHAALAHHHAARLASERHSDFPLASYQAREATRAANTRCQRQVSLEARKAAGDGFSAPAGRTRGSDGPFSSEAVREQRFREPRTNPYAFRSSGRVSGGPREAGDDNSPEQPIHPFDFLLNPVNDPRRLNWSREDLGSPGRERGEGMDYPASQPAKAAGAYDPNEPLVAMAKRLMSGSAGTAIAKSLDVAFEHRHELGEGLYRDYVAMRSNLADARSPGDWRRSDLYRDLVNRIERAAVSRVVKGELISALA